MTDELVVIHQTADPVEAEMIEEILVEEGIDVRLGGPRNAALLGVAAHIVPLRVEVPRHAAERASELIDALLAPKQPVDAAEHGSESRAEDGGGGEQPAEATIPHRRSRALTAGAALVLPGASHMVAGRPWAGLVVLAGFAAAFWFLLRSGGRQDEVNAATLTMVLLVASDMLGGLRALRATEQGVVSPRLRQLGRGAVLVGVASALGITIGPRLPEPEPERDPELDLLLRSSGRGDLPAPWSPEPGRGIPTLPARPAPQR